MKKYAIGLIAVLGVSLVVIYAVWPDEQLPEPPRIVEPTTSRLTTEGEYVGFMDRYGARAWLGIPFATPPVGELRWTGPKRPPQHEGVKEALAFGEMCIQYPNATLRTASAKGEGVVGNEDCLYLNIWAPANSIDAPVMFWIHGGGNSVGEAANYNGSNLATKHKVVVVTTNYRLGVMGWFNHPAVLAASEQTSGNFGTLDLVRALEWVHENIRSFGGNPDNVTVFGESAGGFNTLAMLVTKSAEGLFHRAIVQSGGFSTLDPARGYRRASEGGHANSASEITNRLLVVDGLAKDLAAAYSLHSNWSPQEITAYLKLKTGAEIYATMAGEGFGMLDFPGNFGDNFVLPLAQVDEIFSDPQNFQQVPVILGTNRDEPTLFMMQNPQYVDYTFGMFPSLKDEEEYRRIVHYGARAYRVRGVDRIAAALRSSGHEHVYAYRFDWDEEPSIFLFDLSVALGAGHAIEIPFVFGGFTNLGMLSRFYPNDEAQFTLSDSMTSYWAEFAYNGNPGRGRDGSEVHWAPFDENGESSIVFDTAADGGIRMISDIVTYESIRDELLADDSFNDKDVYCHTYFRTLGNTPVFSQQDIEQIGCGHLNTSEISWF